MRWPWLATPPLCPDCEGAFRRLTDGLNVLLLRTWCDIGLCWIRVMFDTFYVLVPRRKAEALRQTQAKVRRRETLAVSVVLKIGTCREPASRKLSRKSR